MVVHRIESKIFKAKVSHKRLIPKPNQFNYSAFYLAIKLSELNSDELKKHLSINQKAKLSFFSQDHGSLDASSLENWIRNILKNNEINDLVEEIILFTMPRFLNYVFNPVSFWVCLDKDKQIRAVLAEVNNTFNETHSYLCFHYDKRVIHPKDVLMARKVFYVSPFLETKGDYQFRFSYKKNYATFWVDFFDANNQKKLTTTLTGRFKPLTKANLNKSFWTHPHITFKAIFLIHFQALKLWLKGIAYIPKPKQLHDKLTTTKPNTKPLDNNAYKTDSIQP